MLKAIEATFSLADAELPCLRLTDGTLEVNFVDWRCRHVDVAFEQVALVTWAYAAADEGVFEVAPSELVLGLVEEGTVSTEEAAGLKHFRLGFNEGGLLNAVAVGFTSVSGGPGDV